MDDMQLEALRRAETMRGAYRPKQAGKKMPAQPEKTVTHEQTPKTKHENTAESPRSPEPTEETQNIEKPANTGDSPLDFLLKDRETTLILMMIFFLYEDNSDPMLIMALVYLLID